MGAADHRALPRGPPGRRARGLPARPRAARRRPRARAGAAAAASSSARSSSRTPCCAPRRGEPAVAARRARGPRRRGRRARRAARARSGSSRSSGPAASARPRRDRRRPRARPARVWLVRLEAAHDGRRRPRHRDRRARASPAARRRCSSGCARARTRADPRQLRARRSTPPRRWPSACSTRRPELRILCTSQVALERRRRGRARARAARARRTPSSCSPLRAARPGDSDHVHRAVPRARRPAAGDRAGRRAHADAVGRGDRPPPRRPLHRPERPGQPQAGAPPRAEGDDRLELRAAVPRRPARPVGAGHVQPAARRWPPWSRCSKRSTSRAAAIDVVGRLASRSLVIVDDPPRYRLLDSIRAFALEEMAERDSAPRRARGVVRGAAAASTAGVRSARQAEYLELRPHRAREHRRRARLVRGARPARAGSRSPPGSAGRGSCSATSRGAQRLLDALTATASAPAARPRDRAAARRVDRGVLGPPRAGAGARRAAAELASGDPDLAGALRLLPRLRRLPPRRLGARARAHRRARAHAAGPARGTRRPTRCSPPARRSRPATSRAPPRRATRSSAGCASSTTRGCTSAATRCSASSRGVERRFDDAVDHIGRAAETSGRLGFLQTEAYQLTSLGRAQCQAGDYEAGAATLERGDRARRRRPATCASPRSPASISAASCARSGGPPRRATALEAAAAFHRAAGGGEQARLGDTPAGGARRRPRPARGAARGEPQGDAPVEVFALDALGRSRRGRPPRWRAASHFITERDRTDRCADGAREAESPPIDDRDPDRLAAVDHLAEQQVGPHDRQRRLRDLRDPDRADLDRLLRVDEQALRGDPAREASGSA